MSFKKTADLSIQLIVVVVLALVILLVVLGITTGRLKIFGKTAASCAARGGEKCYSNKCPDGYVSLPGTECDDTGFPLCCQKIFEDNTKSLSGTSGIDFEDKAGPAADKANNLA